MSVFCETEFWRVALGNKQENEINYDDTFASIIQMTTIDTLVSIVAFNGWYLYQMTVKNVFLRGDLTEDICMTPPQSLFPLSKDMWKLKHSLYGLK